MKMTDQEWIENFRINKTKFLELVTVVENDIKPSKCHDLKTWFVVRMQLYDYSMLL